MRHSSSEPRKMFLGSDQMRTEAVARMRRAGDMSPPPPPPPVTVPRQHIAKGSTARQHSAASCSRSLFMSLTGRRSKYEKQSDTATGGGVDGGFGQREGLEHMRRARDACALEKA